MQELLKPKKGWEVKKLGDLTKVFTKQTGFDYTAYIKPSLVNNKTDDTIPFIQNKDFNNKWINFNTDYYIPKSVAFNFPRILLNEKSLLISISGSVGNVGVYDSKELAFIGGAVAILKFKNPNLIDWVWIYLKSERGQEKLFGNTKSSSHVNLILDDIRKFEIEFPKEEEQSRIARILSDMDNEIDELEKQLEKYKMIKQGMMQNLLTGKIRLI
jgi:restriction endonuclease S subunit